MPYNFFKLTTLEVCIQTFLILTQRHSCTLNGCSGDVPTHSFAFMCTHKHSGPVQYSLKGVLHSQAFRGCSIWLKGVQVHSQAFRGCSILTQRHSCTLTRVQGVFSSDTNENFLMVTPWWVAFNIDSMAFMHAHKCSHSLNGVHAHSMGVKGLFPLTHWHSCTLNGCSGGVQYSLIGIHVFS